LFNLKKQNVEPSAISASENLHENEEKLFDFYLLFLFDALYLI